MITKVSKILVGVALAFGGSVLVAAPASADPSAFGVLSCSCQGAVPTVSEAGRGNRDQLTQGIQNGLADLNGMSRS